MKSYYHVQWVQDEGTDEQFEQGIARAWNHISMLHSEHHDDQYSIPREEGIIDFFKIQGQWEEEEVIDHN